MATLWIAAFNDAKEVAYDNPNQEMTVTISGSSASSAALSGSYGMQRVRLFADTDCHVTWDGDATTSNRPLGAENPEYFGIKVGSVISVIERV